MSKESEIYLAAAKSIASGYSVYSCVAVDKVLHGYDTEEQHKYARSMAPEGVEELRVKDIYDAVQRNTSDRSEGTGELLRDFRVLLLCMMSAVCDDLDQEVSNEARLLSRDSQVQIIS